MGFDEAWFLLEDAPGRRLIEHLNRWGRSEFATPILVTHLISDAEELDNLIGARFMFGFESDQEARAALRVLRLDENDDRLRQRLLAYREGRCLLRDLDGRVGAIRVQPPPDVPAAPRPPRSEEDGRYQRAGDAAWGAPGWSASSRRSRSPPRLRPLRRLPPPARGRPPPLLGRTATR